MTPRKKKHFSFLPKRQHGFNLVEILLVIGILSVVLLGVYGLYNLVTAGAATERESEKLNDLSTSILNSYASSTNFAGLTNETILADKLVPATMRGSNGTILSGWGTPVRVLATDVVENGATISNAGFLITYEQLSSSNCLALVNNAGTRFNSIKIENQEVGIGVKQDKGLVSQLCNRSNGASVQFIHTKASALVSKNENLPLCEASRPTTPETQSIACPAGQYGIHIQTRTAFCTSNYDPHQWTGWETASTTCVDCPQPETRTVQENVSCPVGQLGTIVRSREEKRTPTCPIANASGPTAGYTWNSWQASSSWTQVSNTCEPICVLPTPSTESRVIPRNDACPTGQAGLYTYKYNEQRTATCPKITGNYTWSNWAKVGNNYDVVNTCKTCPSPETQTLSCGPNQIGNIQQRRSYSCSGQGSWNAWETTSNTCQTCPSNENQSLNCPAGTYGRWTQTRSFQCSGSGGWNAWADTTKTCTNCPGATNQYNYQWTAGLDNCPANQYGQTTYEYQLQQSRTVSYNCAAGSTTLPAPTYGSWSAWVDNGGRQNVNSTCQFCPGQSLQDNFQWVSRADWCPAGTYGSITYQRLQQQNRYVTYNCPAGTRTLPAPNYGAWSAWWDTGTIQNYNVNCPTCPGNYYENNYQWVGIYEGCPAGYVGAITYQKQQQQNRLISFNCPAGTWSYPAANIGGWSGWWDTGATQAYSNTCTPACTQTSYYEYNTRFSNCGVNRTAVYGEARRLVTRTCPNGALVYGGWEQTVPAQCCSRTCQEL